MITPLATSTLKVYLGWAGTGTMSPGSAALTSVGFSALPWQSVGDPLTAADIGNYISVIGAGPDMPFVPAFGPGGELLATQVTAVADGANCTLASVASNDTEPGAANVVLYRRKKYKDGSLRIDWALSSRARSTAVFTLDSLDGSMVAVAGMPVLIYDPVTATLWGGIIQTVDVINETARDGGLLHFECSCVSWAFLLDRRPINPWILNGGVFSDSLRSVCQHLVYDYCDSEGLSVASVVGPTIDLNVSGLADRTVAQALDQACANASDATHAYVWYVDEWRIVHVIEASTTAAPWHLSDLDATDANVLVKLKYTTTLDKIVNVTFLDASAVLSPAIPENFVGNGSQESFPVTKPIGATPTVTVGGVSKTVGQKNGVTAFQWYWSPGSGGIDRGTDGIPGSGVSVVVTYQPQSRQLFQDRNITSIDIQSRIESGTGQWGAHVPYSVPFDEADGPTVAEQANLETAGSPKSLEFVTYKYGLAFGQIFHVTLAKLHLTDFPLLIDTVSLSTDDNYMKWTIHCVRGPVIGDYITALSSLGGSGGSSGGGGVGGVGGGGSPSGGGVPTLVTDVTLTSDTTINNPGAPTSSGQLWVVILRQDATGHWTVTWGTDVELAPPIDNTSEPSTMYIISFVGIGTKWYVCGTPILGRRNV